MCDSSMDSGQHQHQSGVRFVPGGTIGVAASHQKLCSTAPARLERKEAGSPKQFVQLAQRPVHLEPGERGIFQAMLHMSVCV